MQKIFFKNYNKGFTRPKSARFSGGFTLVETLVALSIFTFSIVGLIVATAGGLNNTTYAKNKIVATALSAEGIELVRNIRDNDALNASGWAQFMTDTGVCSSSAGCTVDAATLAIAQCAGTCPPLLHQDPLTTAGYFGYANSGTPTSFTRSVQVTPVSGSSDEVEVTSTVTWLQGTADKVVSTTEHIFNWYIAPTTP